MRRPGEPPDTGSPAGGGTRWPHPYGIVPSREPRVRVGSMSRTRIRHGQRRCPRDISPRPRRRPPPRGPRLLRCQIPGHPSPAVRDGTRARHGGKRGCPSPWAHAVGTVAAPPERRRTSRRFRPRTPAGWRASRRAPRGHRAASRSAGPGAEGAPEAGSRCFPDVDGRRRGVRPPGPYPREQVTACGRGAGARPPARDVRRGGGRCRAGPWSRGDGGTRRASPCGPGRRGR